MNGAACPVDPARLEETLRPLPEALQLPPQLFWSPEVFAFEREAVLEQSWICLGRADLLEEPGSLAVCPVTPEGVLLVRGQQGELRAFYNVCPHRGALLVEMAAAPAATLACPYHGWRFGLDGKRCFPVDAAVAGGEAPGLTPVRIESFQGFVFANLDGRAPPLGEWLGDLPEVLGPLRLERLRMGRVQTYTVAANWKLVAENAAESYHFPTVHPGLDALTPTGLAASLPSQGPWQGGVMDLRAGAETVSLDGQRHGRPDLPGLTAQDRGRVRDFLIWPTLFLSVQPDYLLSYQWIPLSPRATRVVAGIHFAPEAFAAGEPCLAPEVYAFWDRVNLEDRRICESQQKGVESRGFRRGGYTAGEDGTHLFDTMVARAYLRRL